MSVSAAWVELDVLCRQIRHTQRNQYYVFIYRKLKAYFTEQKVWSSAHQRLKDRKKYQGVGTSSGFPYQGR